MILDILCGFAMFTLGICVLTVIAYVLLIVESEGEDDDQSR